ncbi:hypothetical protein H6P81_003955 [Aristolochia fimbriata]|uniref:Uncharacterized protein n=1 Tax=Aristolochia fimbriata TaxID=158543 RepID=A0AAV7FGY8_ARIFI|nr:hypothetical protein H6P81_003955 [Aristolochia fimbriata]
MPLTIFPYSGKTASLSLVVVGLVALLVAGNFFSIASELLTIFFMCSSLAGLEVVEALGCGFGGEVGDAELELGDGVVEEEETVIEGSLLPNAESGEIVPDAAAVGRGLLDDSDGLVDGCGDYLRDGFGMEVGEGRDSGDAEGLVILLRTVLGGREEEEEDDKEQGREPKKKNVGSCPGSIHHAQDGGGSREQQ